MGWYFNCVDFFFITFKLLICLGLQSRGHETK